MRADSLHLKHLIIGLVLVFLVFMIEIYTGVLVGTVTYIFIVLCVLWLLRNSKYLVLFSAVSSLLIGLAFFLLFAAVEHIPTILINRSLTIVVIWLGVYFIHRFSKLDAEQLAKTQQLNALFENAHEGILFVDGSGKIILTNPFLEKMFGYGASELLHKKIEELIPDSAYFINSLTPDNSAAKPESGHQEQDFGAKRKDGHEFPVEVSLTHFYNRHRLINIAFISDATEKKKHQQFVEDSFNNIKHYNLELEEKVRQRTLQLEHANQELVKSQALYKAMAHNFPDGIIGLLDKKMNFLLVDGKDLNDLVQHGKPESSRRFLDEIHSLITKHDGGILRRVYMGKSVAFDMEVQDKVYSLSSVPIQGPGHEINEILVVVKNITARKKLENDLIKMLDKEKELNFLKTRFVTTASHEFRSPLTTILSSTTLLERYSGEKLEEGKSKHLDRIKRAVHGLTEFLNDFLSLGKLEEGKIRIAYSKINLRHFMEDLQQEVSLLRKEDQHFEFHYEGKESLVMVDERLLKAILVNLISNAVKYSPPSGIIHLSVAVIRQEIIIQVRDHGIGIPAEEHKYIFKRFFRAQNASEIQGTGLGLNIVEKYVKLMNGSIGFTSVLNKGTTFTVNLPMAPSHDIKDLATSSAS